MLGVNATADSYRFNESRLGAEHWVGGILEFAHSGVSKTHTRTRGMSEKVVDLGFSQKLRAKSQPLLHEDDI